MKDALEVFAVHFYEKPDDKHLRHGDLIDLKKFVESYNDACSEPPKVLNTIYPYFFEKYRYAAVTSQCCDLVRGDNNRKLKVDCIQLGAVLPFKTVFVRWLQNAGLIDANGELKTSNDSLKRVSKELENFVNHNSKLYFCYPPKRKMDETGALRLDVSVSVWAASYEHLLAARISSIQPQYRAKLGWKFAELFGRVGIDEFRDVVDLDDEKFNEKMAIWIESFKA